MRLTRAVVVALAALLVASCERRIPPPTEALELAATKAGSGATDARALALAGWHALLLSGDLEGARARFGQALGEDPGEPWALWAQLLLAARIEHPERGVAAALDLLERAPRHPLAPSAARVVLDHAGTAASSDQQILDRAPALLAKGLPGDSSHLLRSALATVYLARGDTSAHARILGEMGVPKAFTLLGPFSAWHVLSLGEQTQVEKTGRIENAARGPFGPLVPRDMQVADGRFSLAGEPATGDVYVVAVDFDVAERSSWVLRVITASDHVAVLDGTPVLDRVTWQRPASTARSRGVELEPGTHRLVVRLTRGAGGNFTLALSRLDGSPANVTFRPARGAPPRWSGVEPVDAPLVYPAAADLHAALADEAGDALARFVAARDGLMRDQDGAQRLVAGLPAALAGPQVAVLRADLALNDHHTGQKFARGRATRDLEAALARDRGDVHALLTVARLALDDGRQLDALDQLKTARAAHTPPGAPVLQLQARVELALGLDAQSSATARAAEQALPGHCESLLLRYDVARRRDAVAEADALLAAAAQCPGALVRRAQHLKLRGALAGAAEAWRQALDRDQSDVSTALSLTHVLVALKRFDEAVAVLGRMRAQWPRNAQLLKELAAVLEHAGRAAEALKAREQALAVDGSDLALRRSIERLRTGRELLDEYAIPTEEALKAYEAAPGVEDVTSAYILDAAAIRAYPDGSQVDRIHIIQKALDQQGVQDIAEVNLPAGATVLTLRTLKPDGTSLEPDSIDGKDSFSLPGVQVGDLVEYEYLLAHPPRGPGQPGFTAANFYFQIARQPNNWSTYKVIAPRGAGLKVDAHNMDSPAPRTVGELEIYEHEERRVPPYIPEPMGPPSGTEWLPFVSVGAGQTGNEGLVTAYADAFLERGLVTAEVEAFARAAAEGKSGLDAVRAVYVAVMEKLSGRDAGLGGSAAASVGQDRGSRTWLLKAALTALGFDARLAAVRTFTADPSPYLFPAENLLPHVCLRVTVPGPPMPRHVWLDTLVRHAPFGELPEFSLGEREAYLLPEPGRPLERVRTPPRDPRPKKEVRLTMALDAEGVLTGSGEETYAGYDAAQLAEALESISPDQRDQALQGALSRYFGGADLSGIEVVAPREVGANVTVRYRFTARHFGRPEGDHRMVLGALTFPTLLGRRYLATSSRQTPLFIEGSEGSHTVATVTLPPGFRLDAPLGEVRLGCSWGSYSRREQQQGQTLHIDEDFRLDQSRVPANKYEVFGQFAGEVDLVQGRDLLLVKP